MTRDEIDLLKAVCVDLLHAADVGEAEGLLDEYEAGESRHLAKRGIKILSAQKPKRVRLPRKREVVS